MLHSKAAEVCFAGSTFGMSVEISKTFARIITVCRAFGLSLSYKAAQHQKGQGGFQSHVINLHTE